MWQAKSWPHAGSISTSRNRRLFIPDAKAGEREQPITPELADMLAREREMRDDREGWIFPSPHSDSAVGHRVRMDRPFREAVKAPVSMPRQITPHVMRHTAITKLVQAGVDLPTVQRISGHKTLAMVLRYTHVHGRHIDQRDPGDRQNAPETGRERNRKHDYTKLHQGAGCGPAGEAGNKPKLKAV